MPPLLEIYEEGNRFHNRWTADRRLLRNNIYPLQIDKFDQSA